MKKDDLRTGDVVTLANSKKCIVILNFRDLGDIFVEINDTIKWDNLANYDKYLIHNNYSDLNIIKIEKPRKQKSILKVFNYKNIDLDLVCERGENRKITVEQIEKELGYKIEIIEQK